MTVSTTVPVPTEMERTSYAGGKHTVSGGRFLYWYAAMADLQLTEPTLTNQGLATRLGKTPAWIASIRASDSYRRYFAERRAAYESGLSANLHNRLTAVADKALTALASKLDADGEIMAPMVLSDIATKTLNSLGYGVRAAPAAAPVQVNVNSGPTQNVMVGASPEAISRARETLRTLEGVRGTEAAAPRIVDLTEGRNASTQVPERTQGPAELFGVQMDLDAN